MTLPKISSEYIDPHTYPKGIAYVDEQYLDISKGKVSILDYGFLHSDATYDVVHVWKGSFFRLELYLERFFSGIEKLNMNIPYSKEEVSTILHNCVALSGHRDAYVEMICTRGNSPSFSRDPRDAINRFMVFAVPFGSIANPKQMKLGLHAVISPTVRIPPDSIDPSIKNYHWLDLVNGLFDAYEQGGETAILLDSSGNVTEGPGFNIFCVKDNIIKTPEIGVLPGITRRTIFDLCSDLNIICKTTTVTPTELQNADEVFISSTAGGIMPITRINQIHIGDGNTGPLFQMLKDAYWDKHLNSDWCMPINYDN
ncbi:branched-chain amino acid transferase [Alphaproteobacteria bacterium 46_93_T64]|nr:branched-chain amino acid transferase [Alphaproteobacteria bacterium 46_93_T64]